MSEFKYEPSVADLIEAYAMSGDGLDFKRAANERREAAREALAAHDAEVRAETDPGKDERLARYMAMVTPLGYQSALTVVQQMTLMIQAETEARRAGVVAEEPEWEYGVAPSASLDQVWPISEEGARATVRAEPGAWVALRRQRVVLPPWVPVKQEDGER